MLAHVGAEWEEGATDRLLALKRAPVSDQPVPFMAPPLLHDHAGDIWVPQTAAILSHLGRRHALYPGDRRRMLDRALIGNANDVLEEITLNGGRQMWTREIWADFFSGRLPRWMRIFEETGRRHGLEPDEGHVRNA